MKNIFIAGVARSGKSTLSKILNQEGNYNHIPLDYFTSSLKHNFPETKITSNVVIDKDSSKKLSLLLSRVISIIDSNPTEHFIIDSAHILPQDIIKYLDLNKWEIYYIGYPNIKALDKLQIIRKFDTESDWTYKKTDEELLKILNDLINLSQEIKIECDKLNIPFIDTSKDLEQTINKTINKLSESK